MLHEIKLNMTEINGKVVHKRQAENIKYLEILELENVINEINIHWLISASEWR